MTATATAPVATTTPATRHKWTADEKANLIKEIEAAKGDTDKRNAVLAKYATMTGAQPQSVNATYYAAKAKLGQAVGQPRGARKPATPASSNPILDAVSRLVARKAEIEVALDPKARKAMERELKQIDKKLALFS